MGQEKLLELLNIYAKSSYEIDDNFTLDYIKEKIQFLDAWIKDNIEKTPRDLFRLTEEQLIENRNKITETEINNITLSEEELEGLTEEEIIEKKKDKILANQIKGQAFWKDSTQQLIDFFQEEFLLSLNENDINNSEEIKYSENMKIIKNRHKINIEDLNDNFKLITEGLERIFKNVLSDERGIYKNFFKLVLSDLMPLWENILYLWIMYILKNSQFNTKPLIKHVYLDETDFFPSKRFDFSNQTLSNISLKDICKKIGKYVHQYQNCNLIIIPVIRLNNYEKNYYSKESYPGIFYHPAFLNNKLFKPNEKFIIYPFSTITNNNVNSFLDEEYITITLEQAASKRDLDLGEQTYGYNINGDHLYYVAPFNNISNIREFYPKKYYGLVRTVLDFQIEENVNNIMLKNFHIKCYDAIKSSLQNTNYEIGSINLASDIELSLEENIDALLANDVVIKSPLGCIFSKSDPVEENLHKISNFRIRMNRDNNLSLKKLNYYQGECISHYQNTINEDYNYLIEYVPLNSDEQINLITQEDLNSIKIEYVGNNTLSTSLGYKDNDILKKHIIWDKKRNNILEDKFILRIGQHLEKKNLIGSNQQNLISDRIITKERKYFDYINEGLNNEIEEKSKSETYSNSVTIEVGAYLHNPFMKEKNKKIEYYPDFLSHTFSSDYLVPVDVIECLDRDTTVTPEYFSYNEIFKDYHTKKDIYYNIYTPNGEEDFSDEWAIEMIEIISQPAPCQEDFFEDIIFPKEKKTMSELSHFYQENEEKIKDKLFLLPYFTQLCPSSNIVQTSDELTPEMIAMISDEIKNKYEGIVDFFYENKTIEEKNNILEDISNKLLHSFENDSIYPVHYKHKKNNISLTNLDTNSTRNDIEYQLGIYGSVSEEEIDNTNNNENWRNWWGDTLLTKTLINDEFLDTFYRDPNAILKGVYYDGNFYERYIGIGHSHLTEGDGKTDAAREEYAIREALSTISPNSEIATYDINLSIKTKECTAVQLSTIYGGQQYGNASYFLYYAIFYKKISQKEDGIYAVYTNNNDGTTVDCTGIIEIKNGISIDTSSYGSNPLHFTHYPQIQVNKNDSEQKILDESYQYYINSSDQNVIIDYKYLYFGFGCANRFFFDNSTHKSFNFEIFGANFPFASCYEADDDHTFYNYASSNFFYGPYGAALFLIKNIGVESENGCLCTGRGLMGTFNPTIYGYSYSKSATGNSQLFTSNNNIKKTGKYQLFDTSGMTKILAPFLKIIAYPKMPILFVPKRQYPHIYLASNKTLFPNNNFLNENTNFKVNFDIKYKENNFIYNSCLKNYYSRLKSMPEENLKKIPYPFPLIEQTEKIEQNANVEKPTIEKALTYLLEKSFNSNLLWYINPIENRMTKDPRQLHYLQKDGMYQELGDPKNCNRPIFGLFLASLKRVMLSYSSAEGVTFPYDLSASNTNFNNLQEHEHLLRNANFNNNVYAKKILNRILPDDEFIQQYYGTGGIEFLPPKETLPTLLDSAAENNFPKESNIFKGIFFENNVQGLYDPTHSTDYTTNLAVLTSQGTTNMQNTYQAYTANIEDGIDANATLEKEISNNVKNMNLQIIIHWFGPNKKYARKVMTRKLNINNVNQQDSFNYSDINELIYNEWTNQWKIETFSSNPSLYTFNSFKNNFKNSNFFKIFKRNELFENNKQNNVYQDFENYPNTGFSSEGTHEEI